MKPTHVSVSFYLSKCSLSSGISNMGESHDFLATLDTAMAFLVFLGHWEPIFIPHPICPLKIGCSPLSGRSKTKSLVLPTTLKVAEGWGIMKFDCVCVCVCVCVCNHFRTPFIWLVEFCQFPWGLSPRPLLSGSPRTVYHPLSLETSTHRWKVVHCSTVKCALSQEAGCCFLTCQKHLFSRDHMAVSLKTKTRSWEATAVSACLLAWGVLGQHSAPLQSVFAEHLL